MADNTPKILISAQADVKDAAKQLDDLGKKVTSVGNVDMSKSISTFKQQIKEANNEAQRLAQTYGTGSKQFQEAATKAAALKNELDDVNIAVRNFNPDNKLRGLSTIANGAVGAFQGLSSVITLAGVSAEDANASIAKLQALSGLGDALDKVEDIKDGFKTLGSVVKGSVSKAFGTLRSALISTGIGALAVGVGLLIANFDKVKSVVLNLIPGLGKVASFIGGLVNKITDFVGATSEAQRTTAKLIEATENQIKRTEEILDANGYKYDEYTQRKIKANLEYKKHLVEINKDETKSEAEKQALLKQYRDKADFEIDKAQEDRVKKIKEDNKKIADENAAKAKEASEKRKQLSEKEKQDKKARQQQIVSNENEINSIIEEIRLNAIKDDFTRQQLAIEKEKQVKIDAAFAEFNAGTLSKDGLEKRKLALTELYAQKQTDLLVQKAKDDAAKIAEATAKAQKETSDSILAAFDENKTIAETEVVKTTRENVVTDSDTPEQAAAKIDNVLKAKLEAEERAYQELRAKNIGNKTQLEKIEQDHQTNIVNLEKGASDEKKKLAQAEFDAKVDFAKNITSTLGDLGQLAGENAALNKGIGVANATIDTYAGATKAFAQGGIFGFASGAAIIAAGLLNVKKILSVKTPSSKGSSSTNVSAPSGSALAPTINTQALQPALTQDVRITNTDSMVNRAYIVQSDLVNNEQKRNFLNNMSTIG